MRATQWDRETATAFGIDVDRVYAGVFGLGAALAALAAVLIVPIQQAHYLMGGDPLLLSFIVVIIGGLGSLRGTVLAALLIGLSDGIITVFCALSAPSPRRSPRSSPRSSSPWCWSSARRASSGGAARVSRPRPRPAPRRARRARGAAAASCRPTTPTNLARIMVLAVFAMGYNLAFGYTGLLSLGHALFFAAGLYATGLLVERAGLARRPRRSLAGVAGRRRSPPPPSACWRSAPSAPPS